MRKTKEIEESNAKVFTNEKRKDIIGVDYNPLKVNFNKIYEREGMCMKKDIILKEIREELDWKEKTLAYLFPNVFIKVYKKGIEKGFNSIM